MKAKTARTPKASTIASASPIAASTPLVVLSPEAFLADAENEPKRNLLADHIATIETLRNKKRFSFRAIADWLGERGIETDHSAVYRIYMASIPGDQWHKGEPGPEGMDEPGYADENVTVTKVKK